jgi:effector-binding domain-containing protein
MSAGVTVRAVEPMPTAVVASAAASPADFQKKWRPMLGEVWAFLRNVAPEGLYRDGHNIMLYKDDIREFEVGVQVSGSFAPSGHVVASALPGGLVAAATHSGPVTGIGDTYRAVREWSEAKGYQLADARWEIYGDPDPSTGDFDVEVCWLLAAP